jgi:hypothetical protein
MKVIYTLTFNNLSPHFNHWHGVFVTRHKKLALIVQRLLPFKTNLVTGAYVYKKPSTLSNLHNTLKYILESKRS